MLYVNDISFEKFIVIKVLITDCDGVLTDNVYTVISSPDLPDGIISKNFFTRDFWALQQAQESDISVVVLTHCYDDVIDKKITGMPYQAKLRLRLVRLPWNVTKEDWLKDYVISSSVNFDEIAYIGDSENDLEAMKLCAFKGCPSDAVAAVKEESNFISVHQGGHGAVCEIVASILRGQQNDDQYNEKSCQGKI